VRFCVIILAILSAPLLSAQDGGAAGKTYGKLPLSFEANQGPTDGSVLFLSRERGQTLFLTATEAVLRSGREVLRMKLAGANPSPRVTGMEELPGKGNYFIGNDPAQWRTNVPTYAKVRYENVYSGMDLVYYGNQRDLEYDFVVAPGADARAIRLAISGGEKLRINGQGDLVLKAGEGEVLVHRPKFDTAGSVVYSTYLGTGFGGAYAYGIAVDSSGSAYVTGTSGSPFPTENAYQPASGTGAGGNVFVTKFNAAGSALVYSTFLGGSLLDQGTAIAVDSSGNAYVTGQATSTDFPTANAFQTKFRGIGGPNNAGDAFVAKFAAFPPAGSPPSISSVVNGASFASGVVSGSWATIQGSNLASVTDTWANSIVAGKLPTELDGVKVTIGFAPAYIYYISPGQINFIVPPDLGPGPVQVTVTNSAGSSAAFTVTASPVAPAFFPWPNNQVVATRQDFSFAAKSGTFAGTTTVPAKPRDVIILWGTGFGATAPAAPPGLETPNSPTYSTVRTPTVSLDNIPATVFGAALAPGFAGLYQVAIQVPSSLGDGDWPIVATIDGVSSPSGVVLTVKQ
jgi:uncharacterized protein (TIGR03437 family)